ncbi:hypothetical protein [Peristeroidobacter soli]|jgi:hypothetical protein|uniref:hypothetical protein n=1 Tax=Peristeroidobacter soli TaxID=2497877 RepID=UPI00101BF705|nr:hypothetical protein [Peristeroidobacter soli]
MRISRIALLMMALAMQPVQSWAEGDVVDYIEAKNSTNPPPSTALEAFDRFEIAPIAMVDPYAGQPANEQAKQRLQANLDERVPPVLNEWSGKPAKHDPPRVLRIEPTIRHVKFVSGKARFWAGAFAGGTAVLMTVKMSDPATGEVIAEPEFYQHANAFGAAYSFGATDKAMLIRVTDLVTNYLKSNYSTAVGGPTGKDDKPAEEKKEKGKKAKGKQSEQAEESTDQQSAQ